MTLPGPHPRFPYGMDADVQIVIADEVDVTMAGYPARRPIECTVTSYAEQLKGFLPRDIQEGFADARRAALKFAPTPTEVRLCVGAACRARKEIADRERPPEPSAEPLTEMPEHFKRALRDALGEKPAARTAPPVEYRDGKPVETPFENIGDVVKGMNL